MHSVRHLWVGSLFLLALLGVVVITSRGGNGAQEYTIVRTANGFSPSSLVINAGDAIIFKTTAGARFWPASDSHPTHGLYPEFDPKRPIDAESSWTFTFIKPGVWGFHDHLAPNIRGVIFVVGNTGNSSECVASRGVTHRAECWASDVAGAIKKGGIDAGFEIFKKDFDTDPLFKQNCHDVSHILGKAAYIEFERSDTVIIRPEISYCGYGFYHGFIEEMVAEKGSHNIEDAVRYCEVLRKSEDFPSSSASEAAARQCYHGIGHALFDSLDANLWGKAESMVEAVIPTCDALTGQERVWCATGIFHSLANAQIERSYELSYDDTDPTAICRKQSSMYRGACYTDITWGFLRLKNYSYDAAIKFIRQLPADMSDSIIAFYVDRHLRHDYQDPLPSDASGLCAVFSDPAQMRVCVRGAVFAFMDGDTQNQETKMFSFCDSYSEKDLRSVCFSYAGMFLKVLYSDDDVRTKCDTLSTSDRNDCRSTLAQGVTETAKQSQDLHITGE